MKKYYTKPLTMSLVAIAVVLFAGLISVALPRSAKAISGSDFNAGRIIDDFVFQNNNSMSVQSIQNFLNTKVPVCDTNGTISYTYYYNSTTNQPSGSNSSVGPLVTTSRAVFGQRYDAYYGTNIAQGPLVCLKDYVENTTTNQNNLHGASVSGGISAAQIIWNAAQAYNINPQVLIVTLQKEQGLVTDDWPWANQYQEAMGYNCPDTPQGCNTADAGFYTQVTDAAWQFRHYLQNNGSPGNYWVGNYFIPYNPNSGCGGSVVNIQTQATAALYDYTPYQPNAGALAGVSNSSTGGSASCGAYGNRNFWWYFNQWFGSPYANDTYTAHPNGTLVSYGGRAYLIDNSTKRWITNGDVFDSYGYSWDQVKAGVTGDGNLPDGPNIDTLAPGTIFRSDNTPVYVMTYEGGNLVKQQLSYVAYNNLGYDWGEVMYVPPWEVPVATASSILFASQHPPGTLVADRTTGSGKVYLLDQSSKRWVLGTNAIVTNNLMWSKLKTATVADLSLPDGANLDFRQGALLIAASNIYVVDYDGSGILKRPVGPYECFADRWHYAISDLYSIPSSSLPIRTGSLATC